MALGCPAPYGLVLRHRAEACREGPLALTLYSCWVPPTSAAVLVTELLGCSIAAKKGNALSYLLTVPFH